MPGAWQEFESDPQDQAEVADETNFSESGESFMTLEDLDDVLDVTRAEGDEDEDDFDEDNIDDEDLEEDDELHYRAVSEDDDEGDEAAVSSGDEIDGLYEVRDASEATGGEDDFTNFEARRIDDDGLDRLGYLDRKA
jgi:hypothetical protein